jgi:hypothetical protein
MGKWFYWLHLAVGLGLLIWSWNIAFEGWTLAHWVTPLLLAVVAVINITGASRKLLISE